MNTCTMNDFTENLIQLSEPKHTINIPHFNFMWVLKLLNSLWQVPLKPSCVARFVTLNYTHLLMSFQQSWFSANEQPRKELHCFKWKPWPEDRFPFILS